MTNACVTVCCSQNVDYPHMGEEQAGDTHCHSPVNAFHFDVVDNQRSQQRIAIQRLQARKGTTMFVLCCFIICIKGLVEREGNGERINHHRQ